MGAIDTERFEAVFDACSAPVFAYLLRRAARPAAEDALSETFLVAWRRRDELPAEPLPWLYAVARNVLLNQRKSEGRRAALVQRLGRDRAAGAAAGSESGASGGPGSGTSDVADGDGDGGPVMRALRTLAAADREVLLLDAWEQLSSTEGGAVLGISPEAYRARLSRAKQRLRHEVEACDAGTAGADAITSDLSPDPRDPSAVPTRSTEATR